MKCVYSVPACMFVLVYSAYFVRCLAEGVDAPCHWQEEAYNFGLTSISAMSVTDEISAPIVNVSARIKEAESRGLTSMEGLVLHTAFRAINRKRLQDQHAARAAAAAAGAPGGELGAHHVAAIHAPPPPSTLSHADSSADSCDGGVIADRAAKSMVTSWLDIDDLALGRSVGGHAAIAADCAAHPDVTSQGVLTRMPPPATVPTQLALATDARPPPLARASPAASVAEGGEALQVAVATADGRFGGGRREGMLEWVAGAASDSLLLLPPPPTPPQCASEGGGRGGGGGGGGASAGDQLAASSLSVALVPRADACDAKAAEAGSSALGVPLALEQTLSSIFGAPAPGGGLPAGATSAVCEAAAAGVTPGGGAGEEASVEADVLQEMLALLQSDEAAGAARLQACRLLLRADVDACALIVARGGIETLLRLLKEQAAGSQQPQPRPKRGGGRELPADAAAHLELTHLINRHACQLLSHVLTAAPPAVSAPALGSEGVEVVTAAMAAHPDDPELQVAASTALSQMAVDVSQADRIVSSGGVDLLFAVLARHSDDATASVVVSSLVVIMMQLQDAGGGRLAALSLPDQHLHHLLAALSRNATSSGLQEVGLVALRLMAMTRARALLARTAGVIDAILRAMKHGLALAPAAAEAGGQTRSQGKPEERGGGGSSGISSEQRLVTHGCGALWALAAKNAAAKDKIGGDGGPQVLVRALAAFPSDALLQEQACGAVKNVCANHEKNKAQLGAAGVLPLLLGALDRHAASPLVVEAALGAFRNLLTHKTNRSLLAQLPGGASSLLHAVCARAAGGGSAEVEQGVGIIKLLALSDALGKTILLLGSSSSKDSKGSSAAGARHKSKGKAANALFLLRDALQRHGVRREHEAPAAPEADAITEQALGALRLLCREVDTPHLKTTASLSAGQARAHALGPPNLSSPRAWVQQRAWRHQRGPAAPAWAAAN